jgi:mRNA interferase YafQ
VKRVLLRSSAFIRNVKRLGKRDPQAAEFLLSALAWLEADAFDHRLKTHKLKGDLADSWACSFGRDLRIVFEFGQHEGKEAILLHSLGKHDEVY